MSCQEPDQNDRAIDIGHLQAVVLHSAYDLRAKSYTLDSIWIDKSMVGEAISVLQSTFERLERKNNAAA